MDFLDIEVLGISIQNTQTYSIIVFQKKNQIYTLFLPYINDPLTHNFQIHNKKLYSTPEYCLS